MEIIRVTLTRADWIYDKTFLRHFFSTEILKCLNLDIKTKYVKRFQRLTKSDTPYAIDRTLG